MSNGVYILDALALRFARTHLGHHEVAGQDRFDKFLLLEDLERATVREPPQDVVQPVKLDLLERLVQLERKGRVGGAREGRRGRSRAGWTGAHGRARSSSRRQQLKLVRSREFRGVVPVPVLDEKPLVLLGGDARRELPVIVGRGGHTGAGRLRRCRSTFP